MIKVKSCNCREFGTYLVTDSNGKILMQKERLSAAIEIAALIGGYVYTVPAMALVVVPPDWEVGDEA